MKLGIYLQKWDVDYVVVYVAAQRIDGNSGDNSIYVLNGGGDESKSILVYAYS